MRNDNETAIAFSLELTDESLYLMAGELAMGGVIENEKVRREKRAKLDGFARL